MLLLTKVLTTLHIEYRELHVLANQTLMVWGNAICLAFLSMSGALDAVYGV